MESSEVSQRIELMIYTHCRLKLDVHVAPNAHGFVCRVVGNVPDTLKDVIGKCLNAHDLPVQQVSLRRDQGGTVIYLVCADAARQAPVSQERIDDGPNRFELLEFE